MAIVKLGETPVKTYADLPKVGSKAPEFKLTKTDLADISLKDFEGKKIILNIFPSLDTGVCAASVRRFNQEAANLENTVVICASMDLPYAHKRFCSAEGIENVVNVSQLRDRKFGEDYGVRMLENKMAGLFSRAVVVLDENGVVTYTEQVPVIGQEPNYEAAIAAVK